ncbi:helix-turn-helix domain-containing protein [Edwardsiella piscicida]|nr:helix-turn-helix domain-containing protein [Edwardsiella piscicida]
MTNSLIKEAIALAGGQQELARSCGVRQPSVSEWLRGKKNHPQSAQSGLSWQQEERF